MRRESWMLALFVGLLCRACVAQDDARDDDTVEWVCAHHLDRVKTLFDALTLGRPRLETVKAATENGDWPAACKELLAYYHDGTAAQWLRATPVAPGTGTTAASENLLKGVITCERQTDTMPLRPDGGWDWSYRGPNNDAHWTMVLNGHDFIYRLYRDYRSTGNLAYVRFMDAKLRDWILANPYPGRCFADGHGRIQWSGLEVAGRLFIWSEVLYGLQGVDALTPATRILMLSSIPDHADYHRRFHVTWSVNWINKEMCGLATASVSWPEFRDAREWREYAVGKMLEEIKSQVYPDGVQNELTSGYHAGMALTHFETFRNIVLRAGIKLLPEYDQVIEKMLNYVAYFRRPNGYAPLNSDSALVSYDWHLEPRRVKGFDRPDWQYIVSCGERGKRPEGPPSVIFPWAGQVIMRSGWDRDAQWAFFDVGPFGHAHQHHDKLHLSVSAYGRDLLVDSGINSYKMDRWFKFFQSSSAHNVILIDGQGQGRCQPYVTDKPLEKGAYAVTNAFDYARGTISNFSAYHYSDTGNVQEGIEGKASHTRGALYVREKYWVVVDRIDTDRPRRITALWHYAPDCTVVKKDGAVVSTDAGKPNLRVEPVGGPAWSVTIVKGQETPRIQGWYAPEFNAKVPNAVAHYSADIGKGPTTFAWLLIPAKGETPEAKVQIVSQNDAGVRVRVQLPEEEALEIAVPLTAGTPGVSAAN